MPLFNAIGWGGFGHGKWTVDTDTVPNPDGRAQGWGGGMQWRAHCGAQVNDRFSGNTGGPQWKLVCIVVPPPPP